MGRSRQENGNRSAEWKNTVGSGSRSNAKIEQSINKLLSYIPPLRHILFGLANRRTHHAEPHPDREGGAAAAA